MRKYRTDIHNGITAVEVERETLNSVYLPGSTERHAKRGAFESYHDTWDEARGALLTRAELAVISAYRDLQLVRDVSKSVKGLTKPMDVT